MGDERDPPGRGGRGWYSRNRIRPSSTRCGSSRGSRQRNNSNHDERHVRGEPSRYHSVPRLNQHSENGSSRGSRQRNNSNHDERHVRGVPRLNQHSENGTSNHQHRYRSGREPYIGFKYLESLLEQPLEEAIRKVNENKGFFDLLQKQLEPDFIVLIVKLIGKLCDCQFTTLRNQVIKKTLNTTFLNTIQVYITGLAFQSETAKKRNSCFWKDPDSFWNNFSKACKTALRLMPQFYGEAFSTVLKCTSLNIPQIESLHKMHISDSIKTDFQELIDLVNEILSEIEKKESKDLAGSSYEGEPPDDFRDISVYPTTQELIGNERPFLRKNIVKGPYQDVEQYLDVQFRLLREDFVGPLKEGIQAYLSNSKTRIQNVKIHKKVQFLYPITVTEHYCALLKFNFTKQKTTMKYENSRRFMFGSLVCFTADNFKSLIFGRIVDRNEKYLKNGELVIGFDGNETILYNCDYIMVECSVYFEPYYHVLTVMKSLREEDFPMMNYIIDVDTTAAKPEYITPHTIFQITDHNSVINNGDDWTCIQIFGHRSEIIHWQPFHAIDREFFNFNPSQNKAFIAALTRKFSIIQGPPGTGKTFVGLKIAQTFLHNLSEWYKKTPMLVICYTNHALDQFLEGLVGTTDQIVRIGGQSKNENLTKFNLRNYSHRMSKNLFIAKDNVTRCLSKIKSITDNLALIKKYDCVFDVKDLKDVIPNFGKSWLASAKHEEVIGWLLGMANKHQDQSRSQIVEKFDKLNIRETINSESEDDENNEGGYLSDSMEDLLLLSKPLITNNEPLLSLEDLHKNIRTNEARLTEMENELDMGNYDVIFEYNNLEVETNHLISIYEYAKIKLDEAKKGPIIKPVNINVMESQYIPRDDRWNLYFYWLNEYYALLLKRHEALNVHFREEYKIYNESKDLENIKVLKDMKVIGMTTTGAARLHSSLQMIKSPIVIVEEAAEVLEAHIVTSLTRDCQQLILIGDHQQLKPSTSNYRIEKFYNLGISLFERMVLNNVQCFRLNVQHRMRPEISSLIKPAIYPDLKDHESVFNRPKINGINNCLYFIDHKNPENDSDGTTKKNIHEVKFLIQLARHLILNGYKSNEITILAAYLGQMFELQKERSNYKHLLKDVKITVLDNYQGEECDIILLSLVRNNKENKIGFLSIDNRVCVALSRARNGLYIMGNMTQLCENSALWVNIKESLMKQGALGSALSLECQNHRKITMVSTADDFSSVVEGGCDEICGVLLPCQHNCQRLCHILDQEHKDNKCQEQCDRLLCDSNDSHICKKKCYEECGPCYYLVNRTLQCNHKAFIACYIDIDTYKCLTKVYVTLPCGHETYKPCHVDRDKHRCPFSCDTRLECGHSCVRTCHALDDPDHLKYKCVKPCGNPRFGCNNPELENHACPKLCWDECVRCDIIVRKKRTKCSHQFDVECHKNVDEIDCLKPCSKTLPCGHKCKDVCGVPCGPCTKQVKKSIPGCNHTRTMPCHVNPDKSHCSGKCPRIMSCGHVCESRCNEVCDPSKCGQMISVSISAKCGHIVKRVPCSIYSLYRTQGSDKVKLEKYCTVPCKEILNCGPESKHVCSGSCGACFQGRIHMRCAEKCGQFLICNHECEISCRETCKPCKKPCSYKCRHSACKKKCGEPCSRCTEQCSRRCKHQQCRKRCGDICSVPPCTMACERKLKKCGHSCVGFCGDPCPPLCRICDKEVLEEIFFGSEDDDDARFVLLTDCGHVLESTGMENWLEQDKNEIKFKTCPKCKTTIYTTERYSDYVKLAVKDILKVKLKQCGQKQEIISKREELGEKIKQLLTHLRIDSCSRHYRDILLKYVNKLGERLNETNMKGRAQSVNIVELNSIEIKYQLLDDVYNILKKKMNMSVVNITEDSIIDIKDQLKFILSNLLRNTDDITKSEIEDIQRETVRLQRMIELVLMLGNRQIPPNQNRPEVAKEIINVSALIFSLSKYQDSVDEKVKKYLTKLNALLSKSINVTEAEKRKIVEAIGLSKGHWFKCPNGHPYAIGECGGAMQISKCIECGAQIGGTSHNLLPTNAVATEMDGARHGAWSNAANMANYDLRNLP